MSQSGRPTPRPTRSSNVAGNRQQQGRRRARARAQRRQQITIAVAAITLIAAVVIFVSALNNNGSSAPPSGKGLHPYISHPKQTLVAGNAVDGIGCGPTEQFTEHIHQHLDVVIDGTIYNQPPYVGFITAKNCLYWIHVHNDAPGGIHVEAPANDTYHLGQFLDIWSISPVDQTVLKTIESRNPDLVLVNNKPYGGDVRNITLASHTMITLEYGKPLVAQGSFDFTRIEGTTMPQQH